MKQKMHRLRLILTWACDHPQLRAYRDTILEAIETEWSWVPRQKRQEDQRAYSFAVLWGYALDQ